MIPRRPVLPVVLALSLVACARASALEPVPTYTRAAGSMPSVLCHTALTNTRVDGRPQVTTRCRSLALTMAAYPAEVMYLRDLVRGRSDVTLIGEWFVDGRMSEPLRKALRAANIQFIETRPTTLITDL